MLKLNLERPFKAFRDSKRKKIIIFWSFLKYFFSTFLYCKFECFSVLNCYYYYYYYYLYSMFSIMFNMFSDIQPLLYSLYGRKWHNQIFTVVDDDSRGAIKRNQMSNVLFWVLLTVFHLLPLCISVSLFVFNSSASVFFLAHLTTFHCEHLKPADLLVHW